MITIKKGTLFSKVYSYWVKKGGKPPRLEDEKCVFENLCHFCRVVFGWTLLRWFFLTNIKKFIAPWSITLVACLLASLFLYPAMTLEILKFIGAVILVAGAIIAVIFGVGYGAALALGTEYGKRFEKKTSQAGRKIWKPLAKILALRVTKSLPLWFFVSAIAIGLGLNFVFKAMVILSIIMIAASVWFGIALLAIYLMETKPWETETAKIVIERLKAKKQKICPQVRVELT